MKRNRRISPKIKLGSYVMVKHKTIGFSIGYDMVVWISDDRKRFRTETFLDEFSRKDLINRFKYKRHPTHDERVQKLGLFHFLGIA